MSINENKSVKTYDEGGKGKKQCSSCNKYVGAVTKVCACGFEFKNQEKSVVAVDVKTYDEGGKGKKQCPQCNKYVGAKTSACACGHDFKEAKAAQDGALNPLGEEIVAEAITAVGGPLLILARLSHRRDSGNPC